MLVGPVLPSAGGGTEAGTDAHMGRMSESEDKRLILTVKQLSCGGLNGMRISACRSHTHPGQGHRSPGRGSGWELEFGDAEQPQGEGCC